MAWNPDTYNKFKEERAEPFHDLLLLVRVKTGLKVLDLGCGTGELTNRLATHLPDSSVAGIDSSPEMLKEAYAVSNSVTFKLDKIEMVTQSAKRYDLVFSNAALQWVDDHKNLLSAIVSMLNDGGQLAIQVPSNDGHFTHALLRDIATKQPYRLALNDWARLTPVLDIETYAQLLYENGCTDITVYEKVYTHLLKDAEAVFDWAAGTAMIRYLEKLPDHLKQQFSDEFKVAIHAHYGKASPVFYPFRRIIMHAVYSNKK